MVKGKRERRILAVTGVAALVAVGLNLLISAVKAHMQGRRRKRDVPGLNVLVNLSATEIHKLTDQIIAKSKEVHDLVASVPLEKVSYMNTISPLAELEAYQFPMVQACVFHGMVFTSNDIQKAGMEAERRLDLHFSACRKREDVYCVIKAFADRGEWPGYEAKRYTQCLVEEFERNGVCLNPSKKNELECLGKQIEELSFQYIQNLKMDNSFLLLSEVELAGMPLQFIESLEKIEDGRVKVFLKSANVTPILEHCKIRLTRRLIAVAFGQRCGKQNLDILENLVQLRHKYARLLGFSNYAEFALQSRMVRTSEKVCQFLEDLSESLSDLAIEELNVLKDLKIKDDGDSHFGMEDLLYYMRRAEEQHLDLDFGEVKRYFPVNLVLSGILKFFQDMFGLKFQEIKDVEVWHETVCLFSVTDVSSSELLGYFYLDIFSREGKYAHTCVLALQNGGLLSSGMRQLPVALLISQCPKQLDDNPVLLRFSEVVTLFHEFTHVVHHICMRATFSRFSGLQVDADFIEIPSKLLENWCYQSISLKMMSGYYQDITKSVTTNMCTSLRRKRDLFSGLKLKQEILLCLMDQFIYSSPNANMLELLKHLHPKVMLGIPLLEGTNPASSFPQIAIGSEATCYSSIWSEAIAADIFASKFQEDLLNQHAGLQFRNKVLAPGGAKESLEILSDYLGREPTVRSFIESKTKNSF
ncbi:putative thimet oligopeptidase isoform X1 [Curcuma longa]|uniref:putative thimet oligopeptidase isoform X1 n=1 Tax=Curcuma longa TaxID=136217 RepID=UPI003D9E9DA2